MRRCHVACANLNIFPLFDALRIKKATKSMLVMYSKCERTPSEASVHALATKFLSHPVHAGPFHKEFCFVRSELDP